MTAVSEALLSIDAAALNDVAEPLAGLVEPAGVLRHFQAHPPQGFATFVAQGAPAFAGCFDLLTTAEQSVRQTVCRLPGYRHWSRLLQPTTCFVGSTVTEYALWPSTRSPREFVGALKRDQARRFPFLIIKDIPYRSPLLGEAMNAQAEALVDACRAEEFLLVQGQALAYLPIDFASIDAYLARLSAGRRKDLRRKLRARAEVTVEQIATGHACFFVPEFVAECYGLYLEVYRQSTQHFDLLSAEFFAAVLQDASYAGVVFIYRRAGQMIGWNLCFETGGRLIDKYIGLRYPAARDVNLYFTSWIHNIEYALQRGLNCYVAGWSDPEVKASLGAQFTFTRHAVHIRSRLLRAALRPLRSRFEADKNWFDALECTSGA